MATKSDILAWLNAHPNATDVEIRAAMDRNGVTPAQLAEAIGRPEMVVQQRYEAATPPVQEAAPNAGLNLPQGGQNANDLITKIQNDLAAIRAKHGSGGVGAEQRALAEMAEYARVNNLSPDLVSQAARGISPNPERWNPASVQTVMDARTIPTPQNPTSQLPAGVYGENYGLGGAESAILTGSQFGLNQIGDTQNLVQRALEQAGVRAGQTFGEAGLQAGQTFDTTRGQVGNLFGGARAGIQGALGQTQSDITGMYGNARTDLNNIYTGTQGQVSDLFGKGVAGLTPYIEQGQGASQLQAALSGALGPEAQAQAYAQYQESPGVAFAREESERAQLRNAAALGGLSGGNIRDELSRRAVGTYMQDFGNQFNRMGTVADRGLSAAGVAGGLRGQEAGVQSALGQGRASTLSGLAQSEAGTRAGLGTTEAGLLSSLGADEAGIMAGLGTSQVGIQSGLKSTLGNIQSGLEGQNAGLQAGLGQYGAQIPVAAGSQIGGYRYQAGRDIANSISGTSSALANLINQQGAGVSDITGNMATNVNSLIQAATAGDVAAKQQLATLLTNVSSQAGSSYAGQPIVPGAPSNLLGTLGQVAGGIGGLVQGYNQMGNVWNPTSGFWQAPSMYNTGV